MAPRRARRGGVPVIAPKGGQDAGPEETDASARYRTPPSAPPPAHSEALDSASELASMERAVRVPPTEELGAPARQGAPPPSLAAPASERPCQPSAQVVSPCRRQDLTRVASPCPLRAPRRIRLRAPRQPLVSRRLHLRAPRQLRGSRRVPLTAWRGLPVSRRARRTGAASGDQDSISAKRQPVGPDGAGEPSTGRSARVPEDSIPPPELRDRAPRGKAAEQSAPPIQLPAPLAPAAHVVGRLTVKDRQAAHRDLADS